VTLRVSSGVEVEQVLKTTQYSILSHVWVTVDGVWIGNWIYWTLTDHNYQ
jgi:hypothetical protein